MAMAELFVGGLKPSGFDGPGLGCTREGMGTSSTN